MSTKEKIYSMINVLNEDQLNTIVEILTKMVSDIMPNVSSNIKNISNNLIENAGFENYQTVSDEAVKTVSKRLIDKNLEAYTELAK